MALEALCCLRRTIRRLHVSSRISIESSDTREILRCARNGVESTLELIVFLEDFKDGIGGKKMGGLEGEIIEAARELEDALDFHVSESQKQPLLFSLELQGLRQDVDGFTEKMKKIERVFNPWFVEHGSGIFGLVSDEVSGTRLVGWFATKAASVFMGVKEDYIHDLQNLLPEQKDKEDYADLLLLPSDFRDKVPCYDSRVLVKDRFTRWWMDRVCATDEHIQEIEIDQALPEADDDVAVNMVGLADLFCKIRDTLVEEKSVYRYAALIGMAGIGKTALAKKITQDPLISSKFECCVFVRVGQKYEEKQVMRAILAQLNPENEMLLMEEEEDDLFGCVKKSMQGRKCLIVLDDVWDIKLWHDIMILPFNPKGNKALLTTRIHIFRSYQNIIIYQVPFLNLQESWDLLRGQVFGEQNCPAQNEKAGMKIAENCEGLPLLILKVARLLSDNHTPEYWNEIAANKTNSIFVAAYEQILEVVRPSYNYLPHHLKTCFLYMAVFPQNGIARISKLINLWSAEGFLDEVSYQDLQHWLEKYFAELVHQNLALDSGKIGSLNLKACELHSVFWYLCKRVAWDERFLHVLSSYTDAGVEDIEIRRRLSIYNNILFSIKDVCDSIASLSTIRSLLCTGPYHQYQVPICLGLRLLKVLDALTVRFYEFPIEVVKLVHLRYLALTCSGNLPPSISNLWNLQCLILKQHQRIKTSVSHDETETTYVPVEIWELQELEYLQITGRNLPDPPPGGAMLRNLITLLDVGAHSCNDRVLSSIPNVKKLRVQIELMPDPAQQFPIDHISHHLQSLDCLHYVVMNPTLIMSKAVAPPPPSLSSVTKLTLSGVGYPWKDMKAIAESPLLKVLKLKCYAFRGEVWQVKGGDFKRLWELCIEDSDVVEWSGRGAFPNLALLTIKNCYKLLEFPEMPSLLLMRLVDCNPSAETCVQPSLPEGCHIYVESSIIEE